MQEVKKLEAQAKKAGTDRDLILGSILICFKQRQLFLQAGFDTLWSYLAHNRRIYGFGRRQAERIMRGYSVLRLLQDHALRPTSERQVRELAELDAATARRVWSEAVRAAQQAGSLVTPALVHSALQCQKGSRLSRPVHLSSATSQWNTPPTVLNLVRKVFQGNTIDLDPCSDVDAQQYVQAKRFYTAQQDGLSCPWKGRVFINPPFSAEGGHSLSGSVFHKAEQEFSIGNASEVVILLNAAVGYAWFQPVLQWPHAWLLTRISFMADGQVSRHSNPHGSIVVYLGPNTTRFYHAFKAVASIPGGNSWALPGPSPRHEKL